MPRSSTQRIYLTTRAAAQTRSASHSRERIDLHSVSRRQINECLRTNGMELALGPYEKAAALDLHTGPPQDRPQAAPARLLEAAFTEVMFCGHSTNSVPSHFAFFSAVFSSARTSPSKGRTSTMFARATGERGILNPTIFLNGFAQVDTLLSLATRASVRQKFLSTTKTSADLFESYHDRTLLIRGQAADCFVVDGRRVPTGREKSSSVTG